jgi:hypothetical protein
MFLPQGINNLNRNVVVRVFDLLPASYGFGFSGDVVDLAAVIIPDKRMRKQIRFLIG